VIVTACLGARSAAEVERNTRLLDVPIPDDLWSDLNNAGLMRSEALP
jgi:D-threo-aldose 1-dehydrogenase